jgi:hypothetical protein
MTVQGAMVLCARNLDSPREGRGQKQQVMGTRVLNLQSPREGRERESLCWVK